MLSSYGTEQIGISAEVAIADLSHVEISFAYRLRGRNELIEHMKPALQNVMSEIPHPTMHIAEDQNPVDFILDGSKTLSVKTNMRQAGKIAPQNIGQPTSSTFWSRLPELVPEGIDISRIDYSESVTLFKRVAQSDISILLRRYWENLFDCDYMIYVCNVLDKQDKLSSGPTVVLYEKSHSPNWESSKITFSKTLETWNESCTVRYNGVSVGEFQIHNNRDCFKFRFNIAGLITAGLI
jgi:hypothetical protein